jgi:hypothetical protein
MSDIVIFFIAKSQTYIKMIFRRLIEHFIIYIWDFRLEYFGTLNTIFDFF